MNENIKIIFQEFSSFCLLNDLDKTINKLFKIIKINKLQIQEEQREKEQREIEEEEQQQEEEEKKKKLYFNSNFILKLIQIIRRNYFQHTKERLYCSIWDKNMTYILLYYILPCQLEDTWERIFKEIINNDLHLIKPYDGSNGIIVMLIEMIYKMYSSISSNNKVIVLNLLQHTQSNYSILHVIDENGWNLLHHASYHNVPNIIEILVSSGISLNSLTTISYETPLHIAAGSLRYDAIITLRRLGAKIIYKNQLSPLQTFINTFRYGNWIRRISPHQILHCINELSINEFDIWNYSDKQLFSSYIDINSLQIPIIDQNSSFLNTKSNTNIKSKSFTIFTIALGCTDVTICKDIIHLGLKGFQFLKDLILQSLQSLQTNNNHNNNIEMNSILEIKFNLLNHIIHTIKETIFYIIRKKKARILKLLIQEFWDYLCIGSMDPLLPYITPSHHFHSPIFSLFSDLDNLSLLNLPTSNNDCNSHNEYTIDIMKESIKFWCQSMFLTTSSSSLRIIGIIITPYITSIHTLLYHFISELHLNYVSTDLKQTYNNLPIKYEEILNYFTLTESFLLNPILRSDSTMLIYILDMCTGSYQQKTNNNNIFIDDDNDISYNSTTNVNHPNSEIYQLQLYKNHIYHCLLTNWITLPSNSILYSIPSLCIPSLSSIIFQSSLISSTKSNSFYQNLFTIFYLWCKQSSFERKFSTLYEITSKNLSPLTVACLMGNTYILQLLLQKCIFSTTYQQNINNHKNNHNNHEMYFQLFNGFNPLFACILSGSSGTMKCLYHYLGDELFTYLCNLKQNHFNLLPLQLFLCILNIQRKESFIIQQNNQNNQNNQNYQNEKENQDDQDNQDSENIFQDLNISDENILYQQILSCYLNIHYNHSEDIMEMLQLLLSKTKVFHKSKLSIDIFNNKQYLNRINNFQEYQNELEIKKQELINESNNSNENLVLTSEYLELKKNNCTLYSLWINITNQIQSVFFITKLKVMIRNILPNNSDNNNYLNDNDELPGYLFGIGASDLKNNRQYTNIIRVMVMLFQYREKYYSKKREESFNQQNDQQSSLFKKLGQFQVETKKGPIDWWKLFADYINDDYTISYKSKNLSSSSSSIGSQRNSNSSSKIVNLLLDFNNITIPLETLNEIKEFLIIPNIQQYEQELEQQLEQNLEQEQSNKSIIDRYLIPIDEILNCSYIKLFCSDSSKRKCNNTIELTSVCEVLDIFYKWIMILIHQNLSNSSQSNDLNNINLQRIVELDTEINNVNEIIEDTKLKINHFSSSSFSNVESNKIVNYNCYSLLHWLIGKYCIPNEIHLIVTLLTSYRNEVMYLGFTNIENQFPCQYNNWINKKEDLSYGNNNINNKEDNNEENNNEEDNEFQNDKYFPFSHQKQNQNQKGKYLEKRINYTLLIDEISTFIISKFTPEECRLELYQPGGIPPLLLLSIYDCFNSAQLLVSKLFTQVEMHSLNGIEHYNFIQNLYHKSTCMLFPGGISELYYLTKLSNLINKNYRDSKRKHQLLYQYLNYNNNYTTNNNTGNNLVNKLKYCDLISFIILKRLNSFLLSIIPSLFPIINNIHEFIILSYFLDNPILCIQLGWYCYGNNINSNFNHKLNSNQIVYINKIYNYNSSFQFINHISNCITFSRLCRLNLTISDDIWDKKLLSGYNYDKLTWKKILKNLNIELTNGFSPEITARYMIQSSLYCHNENNQLYLNYFNREEEEERKERKENVNEDNESSDNESKISTTIYEKTSLQIFQEKILKQYGVIPQLTGDYCGLCLSNNESIWLINGSLISKEEFFSDVNYLFKALPCPSSIQKTGISTRFTILHGLIHLFSKYYSKENLIKSNKFMNPLFIEYYNDNYTLLETIYHNWLYCSQLTNYKEFMNENSIKETLSTSSITNLTISPFKNDISGKSPIYMSIVSNNINQIISLTNVNSIQYKKSLKTLTNESNESDNIHQNNNNNNNNNNNKRIKSYGKIVENYLTTSIEKTKLYEESLYNRLQGSYIGNCHGSLIYSLIKHLDRLEVLYDYILNECNMTAYTRMIYDPVGVMIDCLQKSKTCLFLLNIPYSMLTRNNNSNNNNTHNNNTKEVKDEEYDIKINQENRGKDSNIVEKKSDNDMRNNNLNTNTNTNRQMKNPFQHLTPQNLKKLYSWDIICKVKNLLYEWIEEKKRNEEYISEKQRKSNQKINNQQQKQKQKQQNSKEKEKEKGLKSNINQNRKILKNNLDISSISTINYLNINTILRLIHLNDVSVTEYLPKSPTSETISIKNEVSNKLNEAEQYLWENHIPPFLLAETRIYRKHQNVNNSTSNSEIVKLLSNLLLLTKKNSTLIYDSLRTSIIILEFIRTLCNARILVSLTTENNYTYDTIESMRSMNNNNNVNNNVQQVNLVNSTIPSSQLPRLTTSSSVLSTNNNNNNNKDMKQSSSLNSFTHPLDLARKKIKVSREKTKTLHHIFKKYGENTEEMEKGLYHEFFSLGAQSRIRTFDNMNLSQFQLFFELDMELSPTFTSLRYILLSCIYVIIQIKYYSIISQNKLNNTKNEMKDMLQLLKIYLNQYQFNESIILFGDVTNKDEYDDISIQSNQSNQSFQNNNGNKNHNVQELSIESISILTNYLYYTLSDYKICDICFLFFNETNINKSSLKSSKSKLNYSISPEQRSRQKLNELMLKLYSYMMKYKEIFQPISFIPFQNSQNLKSITKTTSSKELVPLVECPCQQEINDIINVFSYNTNFYESSKSNLQEEINKIIQKLKDCYKVCHNLIEYIISIVGAHSMSSIYIYCDQSCWKGILQHNPIISICYSSLFQKYYKVSPEDIYHRLSYEKIFLDGNNNNNSNNNNNRLNSIYSIKDYGYEYHIIECFDKLVVNEINFSTLSTTLLYSNSNSNLNLNLSNEILFANYSQLDYLIFITAIFGRPYLLERLLKIKQTFQTNDNSNNLIDKLHIIWCVSLISPSLSFLSSSSKLSNNLFEEVNVNNQSNYFNLDIYKLSSHYRYQNVLLLLLQYGYKATQPNNTMLSILDLLSLKSYIQVINYLVNETNYLNLNNELNQGKFKQFGYLHFMILNKYFPYNLFEKILSNKVKLSKYKDLNEIINFTDFINSVKNDVHLISFIMEEIQFNFKQIKLYYKKIELNLDEYNFSNVNFKSYDIIESFLNDGIWNSHYLVLLTIQSLSSLVNYNGNKEIITIFNCPLKQFFHQLIENIKKIDDIFEVNNIQNLIPLSSISWTTLTISIASTIYDEEMSSTSLLSSTKQSSLNSVSLLKYNYLWFQWIECNSFDSLTSTISNKPLSNSHLLSPNTSSSSSSSSSFSSSLLSSSNGTMSTITPSNSLDYLSSFFQSNVLHIICYYGFSEAILLYWNLYVSFSQLRSELKISSDFNPLLYSLFFQPFGNVLTPYEVIIYTGSYKSYNIIMTIIKSYLSNQQLFNSFFSFTHLNQVISNNLFVYLLSSGRGGERIIYNLFQLSIDIFQFIHSNKHSNLLFSSSSSNLNSKYSSMNKNVNNKNSNLLISTSFPSSYETISEYLVNILSFQVNYSTLPSHGSNISDTILNLLIKRNYYQVVEYLITNYPINIYEINEMCIKEEILNESLSIQQISPLIMSISLGYKEMTRLLGRFYKREVYSANIIKNFMKYVLIKCMSKRNKKK